MKTIKSPMPLVQPGESRPPFPEFANPDFGAASSPIANFTTASKPIATNTDTLTSADMNFSGAKDSAIPSSGAGTSNGNNIAAGTFGYYNGALFSAANRGSLQNSGADKPENYLSPEARKYMGYGNAALGGMAAGGQVQATTDSNDAVLQTVGAGIGGAAAGFAVGGPVGAAVGGVAGLVSGGINAYVGTHSARKEQRKSDKIRAQIMAKEEARYQQARADQKEYFDISRSDNQEQARYNRRMAAVQSTWQAQEAARRAMNDAIAQDASLKQMLTQEVR